MEEYRQFANHSSEKLSSESDNAFVQKRNAVGLSRIINSISHWKTLDLIAFQWVNKSSPTRFINILKLMNIVDSSGF